MYNHFKIFLIVIVILIIIAQYHIFPFHISKSIFIQLKYLMIYLINVKIKLHGNTDNLKNNNLLLMANHYDGFLDCNILNDIYYKHNSEQMLHTIVKADLMTDKNDKQFILKILSAIKNAFMEALYLIPYKRGDKTDGTQVKNTIADSLANNKNVLIFPEGTVRKNGVPKDFKHGIFQLAIEKKMNILPITLKYDKDIGSERDEPLDFLKLFDNNVDIYIHDLIESESDECYKTNDYLALKNKTFGIITGGAKPISLTDVKGA